MFAEQSVERFTERSAAPPAGRTASIVAPAGPPSWPTTLVTVAGRTVRQFLRTPQLLVVGLVQGSMFLLIFRYVFGGAISGGTVRYVDFLVPGFVATGVLFAGTGASAGVAQDAADGFADRLRSLPISRLAIVGGRVLADLFPLTMIAIVQVAIGFAVGFRLHAPLLHGLAAFGLCLVYGFAFDWLFVLLGLCAANAQAAQGLSLLVFPLTFLSSGYVPTATMPGWLQAFAEHQPVTVMVDAVRALALGPQATGSAHSTLHDVVVSLLWCALLVAVTAPLAVGRLRRR